MNNQKHTHSFSKVDLLFAGLGIEASTVWLQIRHSRKPSNGKARVRVELLASHYERELSQDG